MKDTSAQERYAASAAWLGMPAPPAEEFFDDEDDNRWLDGVIDQTLGWLYGPPAVDVPGQVAA